jgi:peptide deformylase
VRALPAGEVPGGPADQDAWSVSVYGAAPPGIVHRVTTVLAGADANIVDLTTRVIGTSGGARLRDAGSRWRCRRVPTPTPCGRRSTALAVEPRRRGAPAPRRRRHPLTSVIRPVVHLPDPVLSRPAAAVGPLDDDAPAARRRPARHHAGVGAQRRRRRPPDRRQPARVLRDVSGHPKARSCAGEILLFDPVVVHAGPPHVGREGCMSVPDLTGDVRRATTLVVRGVGADGAAVTIEADAFEARALQHELDHLDGLLFLDRVVAGDRVFRRRLYR